MLLVSALAACAGLGAACDKSLEQSCSDFAHAFRTRATQCYGVATPPNLSTLESRQAEACVVDARAPGSHVEASYWSDCAAAADNHCAAYQCATYPAGANPEGAPCLINTQCASLWCKGVSVMDGDGAVLSNGLQCGACASRLAEGMPCDVATDACDIGLSCFAGVCRGLGARGAACARWGDCAHPNVCKSNGHCDAVAVMGQSCTTSVDCTTDVGCDQSSHVCVPIFFWPAGAVCDGDVRRCEAGTCDPTTGRCPSVLPDGEACDPADRSRTCDDYASCFEGICQIPDPATCG